MDRAATDRSSADQSVDCDLTCIHCFEISVGEPRYARAQPDLMRGPRDRPEVRPFALLTLSH